MGCNEIHGNDADMHSTTLLKIKRKKKRTQNTLETERRKKRERKRTGIKLFGTEGKLQFTSVTTFTASVCVSFIFNFHFLLDHFSCIHEQRTSSPSYVCRLCHMKHADAIAVQTVQTQRLPLQFIAISGCCCLFVCALWRVFNAPSRSFSVSSSSRFRHLCNPQFNCMSLYAVTFSIVSTSFHLHRRASVMRTLFYSEVRYDTQLKWRSEREKKKKCECEQHEQRRIEWMQQMTNTTTFHTHRNRIRIVEWSAHSTHFRFTHKYKFFFVLIFLMTKISRRVKNCLMSESILQSPGKGWRHVRWTHIAVSVPIKCTRQPDSQQLHNDALIAQLN